MLFSVHHNVTQTFYTAKIVVKGSNPNLNRRIFAFFRKKIVLQARFLVKT